MTALTPARSVAAVAVVAVAVAGGIAILQLRDGVVPVFDTATYWSGARSVAGGHWFTTTMTPSFSEFTAIDFLDDGGRLPLVDFPIGYPLLAGLLGAVTGVRSAMAAIAVLSAGAIGALAVLGPGRPATTETAVLRGVVGAGIVALPVARLVTTAGLSEPVFCALALGAVAAALRLRRSGNGLALLVALVAGAGLVRFVGAALALLPFVESRRRGSSWRSATGAAAAAVAPPVVNALWAGTAGGGHVVRGHGLAGSDVEALVRSVGGWFEAGAGSVAGAFFADSGPPAWAWVVAAAWAGLAVTSAVAYVGRRPSSLPEPLMLCLAAAGSLTAAVLVGMVAFDSLVIPDNRVMLPAGVVTLAGIVWSVDVPTRQVAAVAGVVTAGWLAAGVQPWEAGDVVLEDRGAPGYAVVADALDERLVVTNEADGIHWHTAKPAAYLSFATGSVTGEDVDRDALFAALPCALERGDGAVVLVDDAFFGADARPPLDELAVAGRLVVEIADGVRIYRPGASACGP